ncbi:MAG: hypothetical protein A2057_13690 [Ignavibacteria bacterium GWA2_35_9]|nr:MAG: hypothetical protein A2057_13690 [Ignavibacteria bacterium GWA2_35_9]
MEVENKRKTNCCFHVEKGQNDFVGINLDRSSPRRTNGEIVFLYPLFEESFKHLSFYKSIEGCSKKDELHLLTERPKNFSSKNKYSYITNVKRSSPSYKDEVFKSLNNNNKSKRGSMKTVLFFILIMVTVVPAQDKPDYSPKFSGYVRAWHQTDFSTNQGQYLVKQVRLGINGSVNEYAGYKILVDFTRLGKLSSTSTIINNTKVITGVSANFSDILLDAAATLTPIKNLDVTAGQFKVPFSTDNLRSDQNADFANRPLLTNVSPSIRDIGFMMTYKIKGDVSAELTAGSFNGSGFNKSENDKSMDYAFRAVVSPIQNFNVSGNYYGGKAAGNDLRLLDFGLDYKVGSLFVDAEYASKQTQTLANDITGSSYFMYTTYSIPLSGDFLREIVPAVRYEKFDPNTSKDNNEIGLYTIGLTLEFAKITFAHFRINYEKYDNSDGSVNPNKLIFELQTKF